MPFVVWCYWEGPPMTGNRRLSFEYLQAHIQVPICLITPDNLHHFIVEGHPLPRAFNQLSIVHRSDYIRAYLLHHYGGGWHDIKATEVSYEKVWEEFRNDAIWIVGKREIAKGAAKIYNADGDFVPDHYQKLIAVPSWVGRPQTSLSADLLSGIEAIIEQNADTLFMYPAKHPREKRISSRNPIKRLFTIIKFKYQKRSIHYPLDWTLFGNVFHPAILKYHQHVSFKLPADKRKNAGIYHRS